MALDYHRIYVSWFTLPPDDVGGLLLGYRVYYRNYYKYETRYVTVNPDQLQVELTGLDTDTYYLISISAFTAAGEGPWSWRYWVKTCE